MDGLVVERRDDFADAISKTPQYGDYLVIGKPDRDFLKTYINGYGYIALRHRDWRASGDSCHDGFVILAIDRAGSPTRLASTYREHDAIRYRATCNESFVLAENVELVEGPEGVIPSFVRFERFDSRDFSGGKPLFAFSTMQTTPLGSIISISESKIGKCRLLSGLTQLRTASAEARRSKLLRMEINDRSYPCIKGERQRLMLDRYKEIASRIRIWLRDDAVWVFSLPRGQCIAEDWDLGFGPV